MQKMFKMLDNLFNKLSSIQMLISNIMLIFMMSIISFDVIGRNFFGKPLSGTFEMTELASAMLVFFALAMTHQYKEHISIDFAVEKLPVRAKNILNGLVEFVIFLVVIIMAKQVMSNASRVMDRNITTTDLGLQIYPFLYIATFGLGIFALVALFSAIKYWALAVKKS